MNRTEMKRSGPIERNKKSVVRKDRITEIRKQAPAKRSTLKTKGPRMTPIRRAAAGQECTLRIPGVCNFDPATTVLCHSNYLGDGKGMGLKAPDTKACFGCSACHDLLDGRRPRPEWLTRLQLQAVFVAATVVTHSILRQKRLMK